MGEDVLRVEEKRGADPRGAGEEREGNRDQFHREAERLLLDLREGLQERNEDADHRRDENRDERKPQDEQKTRLRIVQKLRLAHITYPLMRPWMRSVHPSTMTNSNSLNGREIVTGETIIMPMARRMLETMMSIAMNGR